MNTFNDVLTPLQTKITFIGSSNPGGGGSLVPQTGDVIGMALAIIAAISLVAVFATFIATKKSSSIQNNGAITKTRAIGVILSIVAAFSLLGILLCYTPLGNAFAQDQVESASSINAYVNEETGEITFDENYIKNNTSKDIVVEASDIEMTEDIATVPGVEKLQFTIIGMDSVLFKGTLAKPAEGRTPQDPYNNLNNTVGSGQTTPVTYVLENYDKALATSLIGKEVCFTTINSVNAVKFSYGVGDGAEGEAPKTQILTNKHNTITIQPLDSEEIVKWGYNATNWKDSAGNTYEPGATVTLADDSTNLALSPNWKENANVTITYAAGTGGTVTPASESVAPATGNATGATATASGGYKFDHWKNADGESVSTSAIFTPSKNEHGIYETATYTAVFVEDGPVPPVEKYTISFGTEDKDKGTPSEESVQFPKSTALTFAIDKSGKITFTSGTETKDVTANAEAGFVYSKWTIKTSTSKETDAPATGTITDDSTFTCYFIPDTREATIVYTIVDEDNAHGTLKLDGETEEGFKFTQTVSATAGTDAVKGVTATPCEPIYFGNRFPYVYYFLNWTLETQDSSTVVSTEMNFKPSKVDGIWTSGTYVAHFATPVAVYTSTNSTMEFFYDEYQHDCTYQYPVNNTQAADENGNPVYASWQSERDGTPAVYPRTVKFNDSFKNYKGLTSMSYWFWSPWDADDSGEDSGLIRILPGTDGKLKAKDELINGQWTYNEKEILDYDDVEVAPPAQEVVTIGYQSRVLQKVEWLSNVYTQNLTETAYMFSSHNSEDYPLVDLDFSAWNCPKLTSVQYMFDGCWGLKNLYLPTDEDGHYFGANATNMSNMFAGCRNLASIEINGKFGEKATDMTCMFKECWSLIKFKPSQNSTFGLSVKDAHEMFIECNRLREVHLNNNFGGNAEIINGMFYNCYSLDYFDNNASKFGTNVKKMNEMFYCCEALTALDLSDFSTPDNYVEDNYLGFLYNCNNLKQFKIGEGWNVPMYVASLFDTIWLNNQQPYNISNIPFQEDGTKVTGEFTRESAKAVYNIGENSNELKFVVDHNYYSSRIFNVPEASGFSVGRSQQWYEMGYRPADAETPAVEAVAEEDPEYGPLLNNANSSAFELFANVVSNNFRAAGMTLDTRYVFPEWFNVYRSKDNRSIECALDGNVAVTFDSSFKNFENLYSMSCWFIADSYGKQPFSSFTGWENVNTNNIQSVACMFGGFSNELYTSYTNWNKDNGRYVYLSDNPTDEPTNRVYISDMAKEQDAIEDTYGLSIKTLDLSSLSFSYDNQYQVLDLSGMFANCVGLQSVTLPTFHDHIRQENSSNNEETALNDNEVNANIGTSLRFSGKYFGGFTGLFYNCRSLTAITNMKETAQYYMSNNYPLSYYKMFFNNKSITEFNMYDVIPLDVSAKPDECYLSYIMETYAGYDDQYNTFAFSDMLRGCDKLEKLYFYIGDKEKNSAAMYCYDSLGLYLDNMGLIEDINPNSLTQEGYNPWCPFYESRLDWVPTSAIPSELAIGEYPEYYVRNANPGYTVQFKVAPENKGSIIYEYEPETSVANYKFTTYANYNINDANLIVDGIHYTAVPNANMHFSYWTLKMGDTERKIYNVNSMKVLSNIIYKDATFTAHFAQDGFVAKAVYYEDDNPDSKLGNRLEFVYDDKDYSDAKYVFEVNPDASATPRFGIASAPTWYELIYKPNTAFDTLISVLLPDDLKHTVNTDSLGSNFIAFDPEVQSFYSNEWVFKTMVEPKTVIFDDSFKNYNEISSISMWFMADHFGTQTYENFYSRVNGELVSGFQNLNTDSIIEANYTFGGIFGSEVQAAPFMREESSKKLFDDDSNSLRDEETVEAILYGNTLDTYGHSIHELDLTGFKFDNLEDIKGMFANALSLQKIKFPSDLNTSNVVYMDELFANDEGLTSSDESFENWDKFTTPNVISMSRMFYSCSGLTQLDLSKFDTRNILTTAHWKDIIERATESNNDEFNYNHNLYLAAPEMFYECVRLNSITIHSTFDKKDTESAYYPWGPGWTLNMSNCSLPGSLHNAWINSAYLDKSFLPDSIPFYLDGAFPDQPYTGTFTREPVESKNVNFVVPEEMQSYGSLDGKTSEHYNFIETAQIQIPTSDATFVLADNTKYNVIPSETGRFAYWTFGEGFSDDMKGQIVPDGYINKFFADDLDYPVGGVTFVANFISNEKTAKAVFKTSSKNDGTGELTFFFDSVDHSKDEGALAVYPVVPNTSDYNLPAWYRNSMESWTYGDSHPIPKFQTIIEDNAPNGIQAVFDTSFADYKELRSMSCWFMSTMSNDEKSIYPGFSIKDQIKVGFENVPTDSLINVAYMFGGHEVFNDHMGSKVKDIMISGFDTQAHMRNLNYMFANCVDLEYVDFTGVNSSNVRSMKGMFYNCRALNGENLVNTLQKLNTNKVEDMSYMFARYVNYVEKHMTELPTGIETSLTFIFPDNFDTTNVTNMEGMFSGIATMQTITIKAGSSFLTPSLENTAYMFANDYFVEHFYLPVAFSKTTSKLTTANGMFENCRNIKSTNSSFIDSQGQLQDGGIVVIDNASKYPIKLDYCINMANMFSGCTNLKEFQIPRTVQSSRETGETITIINASSMFYKCDNLEKVDFACYRFGEASEGDSEGIECNVNNMFIISCGLNDVVSEIAIDGNWNADLVLYDLGFAKNYNNTKYVTPVVWINTNNAMSLSAHYVPDFKIKESNFEESEPIVYKRATKEIIIKNDGVLSEVDNKFQALERDTSIDGYSIGVTDDYNALFKINYDGKSSLLTVMIADKNNKDIYYEYYFTDILKNKSVKFENQPIPTWKRYYDWSDEKQILIPLDYAEYTNCFDPPAGAPEPTICGFMGCFTVADQPKDVVESAPAQEVAPAENAMQATAQPQDSSNEPETALDQLMDIKEPAKETLASVLSIISLPMPWTIFTLLIDIVF